MTPTPEALEQAFLDDIVAHPDDPSLWLILADWLDERDDPRSELVRLTWQLQYEPEHRQFKKRQTRVQTLLADGLRPVRPRRTVAGIEFAWIPPGSFLMGSPDKERGRFDNETLHRVTLTRGFFLSVYPVTQSQWRNLQGRNPSRFSRGGEYRQRVADVSDADLDRFPAEDVNWNDIQEFCRDVSRQTGREFRLPTEAEWEHACRAGTTTPFHFGRSCNGTQANCDGRTPLGTRVAGPNLNRPSPVGLFAPNAWGLYDMHGNIREWSHDPYQRDYENLSPIDPAGAPMGSDQYAQRGGSWFHIPRICRSAERYAVSPDERDCNVGFRLLLVA